MIWWRRATAEGVSGGCQTGVGPPVGHLSPGWEPPQPVPVSATQQVRQIVEALQEEGMTGVVPRGEIIWRYGEHCWMLGFEPIGINAICEALGAICQKVRPVVEGRRITAYVIPDEPLQPVSAIPAARQTSGNVVSMIPSGNTQPQKCGAKAKSARSGTRKIARQSWQGREGFKHRADISAAVAMR